jgi:hypothetical protein
MSLVRPEQRLEVGPVQETTLQQQILGELGKLSNQVVKVVHGQELLSVQLLGSVDGDTKHGRLPIVEQRVDNHAARLTSLEADRIRWNAAVRTASAIAGSVGALVGSVATLVVNLLTKH